MAKVTKEEFDQMRSEMKELSKELINGNGSYGKVDRIYSFILLHDNSCSLVFSPEKDPRSRIGALVINRGLFMAGPTRCRMAGEYAVECYEELYNQYNEALDTIEKLKDDMNTTADKEAAVAEEEEEQAYTEA